MALTLVLAACGTTGGGGLLAARDVGYGVNPNEDSVDGLIVGHRLMAASEYDLALKAYLRAAGEQGFTA
ncbi:MAG: tetratricopeptide repeat protein, partial [Pseudotabrizicola sp.]|nr:tetratricopeptide repeat protein [Pseudotabrizicola sp.]